MINWEELGNIEDGNHGWRVGLNSGLSSRYVPGEGDNPRVMLIGEAPGAQEDNHLRPFMGQAGQVLRQLMENVGLYCWMATTQADNSWLTNVVKFRPPGNRKPTDMEIKAARPWLRAEWKAIGCPLTIVCIGGTALYAVTGKKQSILAASGKGHKAASRDGRPMWIWPMLHPAFGLRQPAAQEMIETDWDRFGQWLADR